jgi:DNA-directed RNA polymerase subunit beta
LAASRSTSSVPASSSLAPRRISFARISEPLEVPDLLALQTASFQWLIGSDEWRAANPGSLSGLEEILTEISPIRDFSDTMSLEFREPKLMEPPHSVEEFKDKDMTY